MGKNKKKGKKNKNNTFLKAIKPYIKDNRVLYSILGAAGVGVAIASAFGTDKGREIVENFTSTLKNMGGNQTVAATPAQEPALTDKKPKTPKHLALEAS